MQVQLLGPVRVLQGEVRHDVPTAGRRAVLGVLGLAAGRQVSRTELVDTLWSDDPPNSAVNVIQTHVKHLRKLLEPERPPRAPSSVLLSVGDGYLLPTEACAVDVRIFRSMLNRAAAARLAGDHTGALDLFDSALALWRADSPLSDVPALAAHPAVLALTEERFAALSAKGETLLSLGAADEAVAVFEQVAHARPLDEAALARLIRGYDAAGRRAAAVDTYHEVRRRLAEELGIGPGPELAAAYQVLLTDEAWHTTAPPRRRPVPATLPGDVPDFVGRQRELAWLGRILTQSAGVAVPVAVVSGTAGVGKTALALHWSHQVRSRFPDGQLYVDLRGYDPQQPLSGNDALARLLSAMGLPAHEIPLDEADRVARYRTELTGHRVLVVLDNVSSVDQVRPLLPGTGSCAVLVTSRDTLGELVARHGARRLHLDLLPMNDSLDLLRRLIGDRLDRETAIGEDLATQCVGLPLALRVAAELAATQHTTPLPDLVSELADRRRRLHLLDTVGNSVSAVFSWSYQHLPATAARVFRLLGLQFGPHVSLSASAALAGRSPDDTRSALTALTRAHLVHPLGPDRYGMHDLLRAYATTLAHSHVTPADRAAAQRRLVDYYLHTANAATVLLGHRDPIDLPPPAPDVPPPAFADLDGASAWFAAEHQCLLAAVDSAPDGRVGLLAGSMATYLEQRGHWPDWVTTQHAALDAARRLDDRPGIASALGELGRANARMGRYEEADQLLRRAVPLFQELSDPLGEAHCHNSLTLVFERRHDFVSALAEATSALAKYRAAGNRTGQARALNNMGWCNTQLGRYPAARRCCEQALVLQREIGDRNGESATLDTLGLVHHRVGRYHRAVACYEQALDIYREFGDRFNEAALLNHLGDSADAAGDPVTAREARRSAREILAEFDRTGRAGQDRRPRT
ncbi:AfsR/SARP family transcriptional regulator [Kitasatospora sp. DSM 101779]|uniref:AfsR/SARP family transcriptional regulator n=1 Tax=Kitasatospora sp. DSM 101779 TaxID=2853165 RepID=UPI0021D842B2|nr:BTAD domain-containing putative transcriptional regulator [Kitasatospora sp. DSM 101779]MCU7821282.1 tetratricopeptide repeat protein [Kitasatospora sp. DSM 101779]